MDHLSNVARFHNVINFKRSNIVIPKKKPNNPTTGQMMFDRKSGDIHVFSGQQWVPMRTSPLNKIPLND